ncbi:MAG: biotin--[acetyl-CoA-carboxylase] ligase [Acidimicrobiales bacterium]
MDSTNRFVADQAAAGAAGGLVAVADFQTAGRGRRGRAWDSPPGASLLCSVLLRPPALEAGWYLAAAAVALAAATACDEVGGVRPGLKWPNDLVVGDEKLGGVLAELVAGRVVVGLGLNLSWSPPGAARLGQVDRDTLLAALLVALGQRVGQWTGVASDYRRACTTIGRLVRVDLVEESFTGHAADVTDDGHLLVDVGACLRTVTAGDVIHLRAG